MVLNETGKRKAAIGVTLDTFNQMFGELKSLCLPSECCLFLCYLHGEL